MDRCLEKGEVDRCLEKGELVISLWNRRSLTLTGPDRDPREGSPESYHARGTPCRPAEENRPVGGRVSSRLHAH